MVSAGVIIAVRCRLVAPRCFVGEFLQAFFFLFCFFGQIALAFFELVIWFCQEIPY